MRAKEKSSKSTMMAQLIELMREEVWLSMRWSGAVAKATGLHPTDLTLLTFVYELGPAPAGRLSVIAGLTTGATTAAINRLEKAGFIERKTDEQDGRKVIIFPVEVPEAFRKAHKSTRSELHDIFSGYTTAELELLITSRHQIRDLLRQQIAVLHTSEESSRTPV